MTDVLPPLSMTPGECAVGWISGIEPPSSGRPWRAGGAGLRDTLEDLLRAALASGSPVFIAFSGGVDSSLLLALAAHTARSHGLPLPVPVSNTYVDDSDADEAEWQHLVLRHLDLDKLWQQVLLDPRDDLVGPHALEFMSRHGVCWPNAFLVNSRALCAALPPGSILLTGDGGDEAFGQRRIIGLAAMAAGYRPTRAVIAAAVRGIAPRPLRRWDRRRTDGKEPPDRAWVREPLRTRFLRELLEDDLREPLSHQRSTEYWARRRAVTLGSRNMTALAAEHGVDLRFPLWDADVTRALQREAGRWGWLTRADIVRRVAGDVLPEAVITRRSKAIFNNVMFGPSFRELVASWDGSGVDDDLIDVDALRAEWTADLPHAGTAALAQQVALAVHRR